MLKTQDIHTVWGARPLDTQEPPEDINLKPLPSILHYIHMKFIMHYFASIRKLKCPAPKGKWKQQDAAKLETEVKVALVSCFAPAHCRLSHKMTQQHEWQNHRMIFSHCALARLCLRSSRWASANICICSDFMLGPATPCCFCGCAVCPRSKGTISKTGLYEKLHCGIKGWRVTKGSKRSAA